MRRASISLLSRLTRQHNKALTPLLSRNYVSDTASFSSSSLHSPSNHLKHCTKTNGLIVKPRQFQANPSPNIDTLVEEKAQISSRQRKIKEKYELEEAFESAQTAEEMLQAFKEMEASFDEKELGFAALKIGLKLDQEGEDPEKTLSFATRALKVLDKVDNKPSLLLAMTLQLMGSANYSLKRFNDSLGYLNRANRILGRLGEEGSDNLEDMKAVLHAVQLELANVKTAIGRREEALENLRKCLEIKEMTLEKDSKELGVANRELAEAYVAVLNFKEALPFGFEGVGYT